MKGGQAGFLGMPAQKTVVARGPVPAMLSAKDAKEAQPKTNSYTHANGSGATGSSSSGNGKAAKLAAYYKAHGQFLLR